ncbi:MAG: hypothetical protein K8U57_08575, partial [Planctomycetes bacterium]|nr:hypothetical protein [Planctomycetota bacterium]
SGAAISPRAIIRQQLRPKDSLLPDKRVEVLALREPFPHSSSTLRDAQNEIESPAAANMRGVRVAEVVEDVVVVAVASMAA